MRRYLAVIILYYIYFVTVGIFESLTVPALMVRVLDVGQGDAILITSHQNGERAVNILVDTGPAGISKYLPPFCNFDLVVLSHFHADHVGGINDILSGCQIGMLWFNDVPLSLKMYREFLDKLQINSHKLQIQENIFANYSDEVFTYGNLKIFILWPTQEFFNKFRKGDDLNQLSVVMLVDYNDFEVLLTGDAESEVLGQLDLTRILPIIDNGLDVLKVPHHGAAKGLTSDLLAVLHPKACVISVGNPNPYHHPSPYTLSLLTAANCTILRTDVNGTIEFAVD
jgi:competence protein ComEC